MGRIKIQLPEHLSFSCIIPISITDINYGGHAGNDAILSIIHEARMQYLQSLGYTEMQFAGAGMIMANVAIEFKNELFYGDTVIASVKAYEISKIGFDLVYKLETLRQACLPDRQAQGNIRVIIAVAKTGIICYDYERKKITGIPDEARKKLTERLPA